MKKYLLLIIFLLIFLCSGYSQDSETYSLLTKKYTERPLTLYKGQLRFYTGYELSVLKKEFPESGEALNLAEDGRSAVKHKVPFALEFGILDYLQISAGMNYAVSALRSRNRTIYGYDPFLDIYELTETKGIDALSLGLTLRSPSIVSWLDFSVSGGMSVPLSDNTALQPEHEYFAVSGSAILNYHYIEKFSTGVNSGWFGADLKILNPKFSVRASFTLNSALSEGEDINWDSYLINDEFEYTSNEYNYYPGQSMMYEGMISIQAMDWLNIRTFINGYQSKNGWSDENGVKVARPERSVLNSGLGFEIQVTPNLRLDQQVQVPVTGKNYSGSLIYLSGFSYSIFSKAYRN